MHHACMWVRREEERKSPETTYLGAAVLDLAGPLRRLVDGFPSGGVGHPAGLQRLVAADEGALGGGVSGDNSEHFGQLLIWKGAFVWQEWSINFVMQKNKDGKWAVVCCCGNARRAIANDIIFKRLKGGMAVHLAVVMDFFSCPERAHVNALLLLYVDNDDVWASSSSDLIVTVTLNYLSTNEPAPPRSCRPGTTALATRNLGVVKGVPLDYSIFFKKKKEKRKLGE